jgi:uncharacterized RDD family membrane protein YckC
MDLSPFEPEYAPLGHRVAARLVDVVVHYGVIFYTAIWLSIVAAVAVPEQMDAITTKLGKNTFFGVVLGVLGSVLYHTCMEGIHGSSIGKRLFGLTVLSEEGGPCSLRQGWKRSLAFLLDACLPNLRSTDPNPKAGPLLAESVPMRDAVEAFQRELILLRLGRADRRIDRRARIQER